MLKLSSLLKVSIYCIIASGCGPLNYRIEYSGSESHDFAECFRPIGLRSISGIYDQSHKACVLRGIKRKFGSISRIEVGDLERSDFICNRESHNLILCVLNVKFRMNSISGVAYNIVDNGVYIKINNIGSLSGIKIRIVDTNYGNNYRNGELLSIVSETNEFVPNIN